MSNPRAPDKPRIANPYLSVAGKEVLPVAEPTEPVAEPAKAEKTEPKAKRGKK